ncbi:hypothetical protein C8R48DRAFT_448601 [Suillus tomentosus]|nr:hypothetical protein C8R48DRAFT_448601 [Suillus tomentosus]
MAGRNDGLSLPLITRHSLRAYNKSANVASTEIILVSFALVVYDYAITLEQEASCFWSGSWSAARTLYLSIRYLALIRACFSFYALTLGQVKTCTSVE